MSAAACPSSLQAATIRARGEIRADFARTGPRTNLGHVHQSGGLRLHCPKVSAGCEAVLINTGGGVLGGDKWHLAFKAEGEASVTLTTQSAERIYRAATEVAEIDVTLALAPKSFIAWLPRETILFEGAGLHRRFEVDMTADAGLLALESYVFGRLAMGETEITGRLHDCWRVRRDGKLVFAEDFRLDGEIAKILDEPACGKGARATATLLYVATDCETKLAALRAKVTDALCDFGASTWNGILVARVLSPSPELLRSTILSMVQTLRGSVPRMWQ
jgi:urease accessory protein